VDTVPGGSLPFGELVVLVVALQIVIVLAVLARGRVTFGKRRRDDVLQAVSAVKEDVGEAVHGREAAPGVSGATRHRQDGVERDNVMRAMRHIKDQIAAER
jgi:hypothetical protein